MTLLSDISIFIAFGTFWVTVLNLVINYRNHKKQKEDITIQVALKTKKDAPIKQTENLALTIKRRHLNRSEVHGVLGAIYEGKERYDIPFLATKDFSNHLEDVQNGKDNILVIEIVDKETFKHFLSK